MNEGDKYVCAKEYWAVPIGTVCILRKHMKKAMRTCETIHPGLDIDWALECPIVLNESSFKVWVSYEDVKEYFEKMEESE